MYAPKITNAQLVERVNMGEYEGALLKDIEAIGMIEYLYILEFRKGGTPCLYVSSEVNMMAAELGGGSHFLCVFEGDKHLNFGPSDDWADLDLFRKKALELAKKHLGL